MLHQQKDRKMPLYILFIVGAALLIAAGFVLVRYQREIRAAHQGVDTLGSEVIETGCGAIEVLEQGEGFPVLVVHGIWGGIDQGIRNVGHGLDDGYRRIYISRFGYLGSPMPEDVSLERQADTYACLLDTKEIDRVIVVAHSAGSTSALQFALRYPERTAALILVSPNAPGAVEVSTPPRPVAEAMFRSDLIFWLLTTYGRSAMYGIMGVPPGYQLTPEDEAFVAGMAATVLPASRRGEGALFDMYISNPAVQDYPLEDITAPTLVIGAMDDPLALYDNSKQMAQRIPGARLVTVERGGHMMLGSTEFVEEEISVFLANLPGS